MKVIIDIPEEDFERCKKRFQMRINIMGDAIANGTPLANDSERAEVQAYFAGQAYGWEQGRKALIDDVKTEIKKLRSHSARFRRSDGSVAYADSQDILDILDNIGKESEDTDS